MNAANVLVTGGAGFLGSHLCRKLLEQGKNVVCLDDLSSGTAEHAEELSVYPGFTFIRADVAEELPEICPDQIYHLACPASPPFYQKDPRQTMKTCFLGTLNVLSLAEKCGARLLFTSTSEVYGDPEIHPQREDYRGNVNPCGVRACYDEGKRIAEALLFDAARRNLADVRVVRLFNTYGPGMRADDGRVISNFIVQALDGRDLSVYGDGGQTRSLCYVNDTISAGSGQEHNTTSSQSPSWRSLLNDLSYPIFNLPWERNGIPWIPLFSYTRIVSQPACRQSS